MRGLTVAILVLAAVVLFEGERLNSTLGLQPSSVEIRTSLLRPIQVEIQQP